MTVSSKTEELGNFFSLPETQRRREDLAIALCCLELILEAEEGTSGLLEVGGLRPATDTRWEVWFPGK